MNVDFILATSNVFEKTKNNWRSLIKILKRQKPQKKALKQKRDTDKNFKKTKEGAAKEEMKMGIPRTGKIIEN